MLLGGHHYSVVLPKCIKLFWLGLSKKLHLSLYMHFFFQSHIFSSYIIVLNKHPSSNKHPPLNKCPIPKPLCQSSKPLNKHSLPTQLCPSSLSYRVGLLGKSVSIATLFKTFKLQLAQNQYMLIVLVCAPPFKQLKVLHKCLRVY